MFCNLEMHTQYVAVTGRNEHLIWIVQLEICSIVFSTSHVHYEAILNVISSVLEHVILDPELSRKC